MDSSDILFEIASRSSNEVLSKLYRTSLQQSITNLIGLNSFWYARTEYLVGRTLLDRPTADWKGIYNAVLASEENTHRNVYPWLFGLYSLDALLVFLEIYGPIISNRRIWIGIESPDVLRYLLEKGMLTYDIELASAALLSNSQGNDVEMTRELLDLLGSDVAQRILNSCLTNAAITGNVPLLRLFYERGVYNDFTLYTALGVASEMDRPEAVRFILGVHKFSSSDLEHSARTAAALGRADIAEILLAELSTRDDWRDYGEIRQILASS